MFGHHIHKYDRELFLAIKEDIKLAEELGVEMKSIQIFAIGPYKYKKNLSPQDIKFLRGISSDINIIIHGSYLDHPLGNKQGFSRKIIHEEIQIAEKIGAKGVIVHIPRKEINEIRSWLKDIKLSKTKLYLEVNHGKDNIYNSPTQLKKLFNGLSDNIGLVLDTAHLWTTGIDLKTYSSANSYIQELKKIDRDIIIHLNDQKWPFDSGSDEHAALTKGTMWGECADFGNLRECGLLAFIDWILEDNLICVLERKHRQDIDHDLMLIKKLI